jgi:hypothetical protein
MLEEGINEAGATCAPGSPRVRPTAITASTWCRSTSITRCSASSVSATSSGQPATSRPGASCSAPQPVVRLWPARACSTRTATACSMPSTIPNCVSVRSDLRIRAGRHHPRRHASHVCQAGKRVFYYITVMNENYAQPPLAEGVPSRAFSRACTRLQNGGKGKVRATLFGSGTILREVHRGGEDPGEGLRRAGRCLLDDELQRAAPRSARNRALESAATRRKSPQRSRMSSTLLKDVEGPIIAATDYMRTVPDQIRQWVEKRYVTLGTDGYGRSDSPRRAAPALRGGSQLHRVATLKALADEGKIDQATTGKAITAWVSIRRKPTLESPESNCDEQSGCARRRSASARHGQLQGRRRHRRLRQARREPSSLEAPLVTLETEKATMDVPSTASGVIEKIHVAKGGTVSTGDLIATVRAAAEPASSAEKGASAGGSAPAAAAPAPAAGSAGAPAAASNDAASTAQPASAQTATAGPSAQAGAAPSKPTAGSGPGASAPSSAAAAKPSSSPAAVSVPAKSGLAPINEPGFLAGPCGSIGS